MSATPSFIPDSRLVLELESLIKSHKGLSAWEKIKDLTALENWRGFEGRLIASKLASSLGNSRLSSIIDWLNWKENPDNNRAYFRALFPRFAFKGSALLVPEMETRLAKMEPGTEIYSDLLGLIASCHVDVREFQECHRLLDQALIGCEDPSWLLVQRSIAFYRQDRYEEALEAALEAKKVRPYYRPVVQTLSRTLTSLGRDEEAREQLIDASRHTDSPAIPLRLSVIFSEEDDVEKTSYWLDEYERKSPLLDKHSRQWLAGRRADNCYLKGDLEGFLKLAGETREKSFHQRCLTYFKENDGASGSRKRLEVEFVRQHNMTCAPATISALTSYFGQAHDHLKIADAICYDGTPWHKERQWCEEHGFAVCEFPVTMASAKALIDAEIPFSLTTQTIDSGHLQACIGYDDKLGLLLLRDPTLRHYGEAILSGLQKDHPVYGLRGLALIPENRKHELEALNLPDQRPYDLYHQLSCAFDKHDEEELDRIMACFREELPDAPLRLHSEYRFANYRGHPALELEFIEKLVAIFPEHQSLWLSKIRVLEKLSRNTEARDFLKSIHRKPESDPFFDMEVGEILCRDVRSLELGQFYLRRALRQRPSSAQAHATYAASLNVQNRREEAVRFRRSASRLNRSFEYYARSYYREAFYIGKGDEALAYLRERADEIGDLDVAPHLTLLKILDGRNDPETPEMAEALLKRFPDDGDLLLETVNLFSGWNRHEEATRHLARAEEKVSRPTWLRVAAQYWSWTGHRKKSREYWEQLIEVRPLYVNAYESVARHLAEEEDRETAVAFMKKAHEQNPDYLPLLKSYIEWEEFNGPEVSTPLLEKAVALDPTDLWSIRELALELSKADHFDEAIARAREALAFDPDDEVSRGVLGLVHEAAGRKPEAAPAFREALHIDIDHLSSFEGLMRVNNTFAERKETLKFVREEMVRQISNGDIVPEYRQQAAGVVDSAELERDLKTFQSERPDLWQTWAALREHYHQTSQHEEELETARKMVERFPLLPRAWSELGFAARAMDLGDEEIAAFQKALELSPSWDWIMRELSVSLERLERFDEALEVLEQAIEVEPLAGGGYGYKADLLWKIGRREEAISEIKRGLEVSPLYQWGWTQLIIWTKRVGRETEVPELIAKLESKRAHQWKWWMCLAEVYDDLEKPEEALAAVNKGLDQKPRGMNLLDFKASLLAQMGLYGEAFETCQTPFEDGKQPIRLQGREAWVMMQAGRRKDAWDRMKALSESEQDYHFAHSNLASWAYETDSWTELKNASERLILLSPDDSESWGYLGQAEQELGNKDAALDAYTRALRASPSYLFGARRKAGLEMEAGKLDEADQTLARIQHHHSHSFINADQLAIELKRCDRELTPAIREKWSEISDISAELDQDPYHYLDHVFEDAKLNGLYEILLSEQAAAGTFRSKAEARAWGRRIRVSKKRKRHISATLKSSLEGRFKASILAEVIAGHNGDVPVSEVQKLISANSPLLEKHYDSWAAALEFFTHHSKTNEACDYGDLWQNFIDDLSPGNLTGYASFVDEARGLSAGTVVRQAILAEFPQWQGTKFLRTGLAFQKALAGKTEEAEELIAGYEDRHNPQAFYDSIYRHTFALIAAHRGQTLDCDPHFRAAANHIREFPQDKAALLYLNASAEACARTLGIFKGKPKKLLRNWAKGLGKTKSEINWWWVLLAIWIISRVIKAMTKT